MRRYVRNAQGAILDESSSGTVALNRQKIQTI